MGLIVEDRRSEVFMVLGVTLSLFLVAALMWFAIADNLFGTGTGLVPASPSISSPNQSSVLPASVTQTDSSGLHLDLGRMSPGQMESYINTEVPNDNVGSWPEPAGGPANPTMPQSSVPVPVQGAEASVRGPEPVAFDFGEMSGEPWSPPEAHGSVTLSSFSTQADSILQADGVINYQLSLNVDDATDGPISIVVKATNATFPASQCFSAAPVYDGVYPYNACTIQTPDTAGFLPLATAFADGTGSADFMSTENRLIFTFRPRTSGTYLFDFSATVSPDSAGGPGANGSAIATAQVFRGATQIGTVQLKTNLSNN